MGTHAMRRGDLAALILVLVAVVAIAAIDGLYLVLIRTQGGPGPVDVLTVPFVFAYLAAMGVLLAASLPAAPAARPALRAAASAGLFALAVLAAFSIGAAVMIPALLAIASLVLALASHPRHWLSAVAGAVLAVALLVIGLQFAWNYLVCPPSGQMSGTTAGFFGSVSYDCSGGVLDRH